MNLWMQENARTGVHARKDRGVAGLARSRHDQDLAGLARGRCSLLLRHELAALVVC